MQTPPICNYEGSDYQTSFWERGGRQYEDAVEEVALRRLLPGGGEHLLELGAGAGRNTLRYTGFERVTLVDYSRTQLVQAQQRLGAGPNYRYVAADIYHLPFAAGSFDAATMDEMFAKFRTRMDTEKGGTKEGMKFPMPSIWEFLLQYNYSGGNKDALKAAVAAPRQGNTYDLQQQLAEVYAVTGELDQAVVEQG